MHKKAIFTSLAIALVIFVSVMVYVQAEYKNAGVSLGPDRSQQARPGQKITYSHVLTNTGLTTDTFSVNVLSTQNWPVELLGDLYPTGTLVLGLEVDAQTSTTFQVSFTVPSDVCCVTETTLITATSQLSPTVQDVAIDTTFVPARVYLPVLMRRWPPLPYQPTLYTISNTSGDGSYTVTWAELPSRLADTYILQEATDQSFTSDVRKVCTTTEQYCEVDEKIAGTYYYRVRGHNDWGHSEYSNIEATTVLLPDTPSLDVIDNLDQDNYYTVTWQVVNSANAYILEEATDASFTDAQVVYQGLAQLWTVPSPGKTPDTYYYRIRARDSRGNSAWSSNQQVVIYPLFVGLQTRWDGEGYIRGSDYYNVGVHNERNCSELTDPDTIRCRNSSWYDPNPEGWDSTTSNSYYSISTGYFKSSSSPQDPSWKWSYYWILPYDLAFHNGQDVSIDAQIFTVSGPHSGYTAFGQAVQYWQLVNKEKFLYWDGGGDWKQYVHPGDITLRYDAGETRLLLYYDVLRRSYYKGDSNDDTVHYIRNLTSSNSFPGNTVTKYTKRLRMPIAYSNQVPEVPSTSKFEVEDNKMVLSNQ